MRALMSWHLGPPNPAVLNCQGVGTHPNMDNVPELWRVMLRVMPSFEGLWIVCAGESILLSLLELYLISLKQSALAAVSHRPGHTDDVSSMTP